MNMHNPPHPGEIIRYSLLEENNLSVSDAAAILKISRPSMSKLVNCRVGVSPEMAVRLSIVLNTSSQVWLNLQSAYDLWEAEKLRKKLSKEIKAIVQIQPAAHKGEAVKLVKKKPTLHIAPKSRAAALRKPIAKKSAKPPIKGK
jgi:addiction module HigA family antidote